MKISPTEELLADKLNIKSGLLTPDLVFNYQFEKIKTCLEYVKNNCRFYHDRLSCYSSFSDFTFDDFRSLPFTEENDLAGSEMDFLCVNPSEVQRIVTIPTSGSSGKVKRISFTSHDLEQARDYIRAGFETFCKPNDKMLVMMSGEAEGSIGSNVAEALRSLNIDVHIFGQITSLQSAYKAVKEISPDVIVGIPSQLAALAAYSEKHGGFSIRSVLFSAEDIPEAICTRLKKLWHCETFKHYGMTELCIAGGVECGAHEGYHLRESDHFFEVINPDENGYGELAVTSFSHEAMPLIRYRTGDIVKLSHSKCACGSNLTRLIDIKGRIANSYIAPNGKRIFFKEIEESIFSDDTVVDCHCLINRDNLLKTDIIRISDIDDNYSLSDIYNHKKGIIHETT